MYARPPFRDRLTDRVVAYTTAMQSDVANATSELETRLAASDKLAPAERRVAGALPGFDREEALLPPPALAERLGTSDPPVARTAKAPGFRGLAAPRRAMATRVVEPPLGERLRRTL